MQGVDGPGQFGFASGERVKGLLVASGWTAITIRPVDIDCSLPVVELPTLCPSDGPVWSGAQHPGRGRESNGG